MLKYLENGSNLSWQRGRQVGGYTIQTLLLIFTFNRFLFDMGRINYDEGDYIPWHIDPEVFLRINFTYLKPEIGGEFMAAGPVFRWGRLSILRASKIAHGVSTVQSGRRRVFTIGIGNLKRMRK